MQNKLDKQIYHLETILNTTQNVQFILDEIKKYKAQKAKKNLDDVILTLSK